MKQLLFFICFYVFSLTAAYQYNFKGNQGWLTFDSETTVSFEVSRSGKDKEHENFIDKGNGISDFGWYKLETGDSGSFKGASFTFTEKDKIGLYVTDSSGNTYLSTKPNKNYPFENDIWGKSKLVEGYLSIGGGNFGSNGTHEYYVFKINVENKNTNQPTGQPLPGIIATLIIGIGSLFYIKKRKELLSK
jgi:hypothetical protein